MAKKTVKSNGYDPVEITRVIFAPKTDEQKAALKTISENVITFVKGIAGSGKTFIAIAYAMQQLLRGKYERLVLTRPVVEAAGEKLGFLPGTLYDKIDPYMIPFFSNAMKLMDEDVLKRLTSKNGHPAKVQVLPLAFMRGLAQPVDSEVLTPNGYKKMKDIHVGSHVFDMCGETTKVIGVYPQGIKKVYRITFSDGVNTLCCDDHLWLTKTLSEKRHNKNYSVKTTKEIRKSLIKFHQKNHEIPLSQPVEFESKNVAIDPYLLGLLLGDGSLHETACLTFTTADVELANVVQDLVRKHGLSLRYVPDYQYVISGDQHAKNSLKESLRQYGLLGTKSHNKFVPEEYKFNDMRTRLEVLQGLLDTDGWTSKHLSGRTRVGFCSTSERLISDVKFLVHSLGGVAHQRSKMYFKPKSVRIGPKVHIVGKGEEQKVIHMLDIVLPGYVPFKLNRKSTGYAPARAKRLITSIEYVGEMECQCIKVDSDTSTYLTNDFIVTHNTFDNTIVICDESQNSTPEQIRMLTTRIGENSKMIICGDISQSDIFYKSGLEEAYTLLDGVPGIGFVTMSEESVVRHPIIRAIEERFNNRSKTHQKNV